MSGAAAFTRQYHDGVVSLSDEEPIIADPNRVPPHKRRDIATVGSNRWDLAPLLHKDTVTTANAVLFDTFPVEYVIAAKRVVWAVLNLPTPVGELERPATARTQLAPTSVFMFSVHLRSWMLWLAERNVHQLSQVNDDVFAEYVDHLKTMSSDRTYVANILFAVTRVWLYAPYLPESDRLARPPWEDGPLGRSDVLGPANWTSENKTPPIHPQTMSALLVWAMRFVNDFSDDILAAAKLKATP